MRESRLWGYTDHANTIYSICVRQNLPFFMKVGIFGLSSNLRALDAKEQMVGTHRSRKHNLQHPYAPKYAIFHENRPKMAVFLSNVVFFALYKQLKPPPPPILRVLDAKKQVVVTQRSREHIL